MNFHPETLHFQENDNKIMEIAVSGWKLSQCTFITTILGKRQVDPVASRMLHKNSASNFSGSGNTFKSASGAELA